MLITENKQISKQMCVCIAVKVFVSVFVHESELHAMGAWHCAVEKTVKTVYISLAFYFYKL